MESVAYILIFTLCIGVLFFAIAFREPPRIEKKDQQQVTITKLFKVKIRCCYLTADFFIAIHYSDQ